MTQSQIQSLLNLIEAPEDPSLIERGNWIALIKYFEKYRTNKEGKVLLPYVSEQRMAKQLEKMSKGCWSYAIQCVLFAIDNRYQGFSDGAQMYFKGDLGEYIAREKLTLR